MISNEQLDKALDIVGTMLKLMDSGKPVTLPVKRKYTKRLKTLNKQIKGNK
jgi:hypothetical protein